MIGFTSTFLVLILTFSPITNGYWLHDSCRNHRNARYVRENIQQAFELADSMNTLFDNWQGPPGQLDAYQLRIFNLLIGGDGTGNNARGKQFYNL